MKDNECIFCRIANGGIPAATVYEDDNFRAILDLGPATKGHVLVIPKEHYANFYELEDKIAAKLLPVAKKIMVQLTEILECEGFNLLQNNGEIAGQTVFHYHLHLIPRYKDDNVKLTWEVGELTNEVKECILSKIAF